MEQETATLILNTFDINPSVSVGDYYPNVITDNQYGTISNNRCNLTWKNINMRRVLGEMYDKYETFNMYLYQINQSQGFGASPVSLQYNMVDVRIKGLPFINNTYNAVSRNNTTSSYLTSYLLNTGALTVNPGSVTPMFNPTILTFTKGVENVDINIDMKNTLNQVYPTITASLGTFIFLFKFYGITTKTQNVITNGSRM